MCTHEHDTNNYQGYQKNNFLNYHNRFTNAASCSWEIRKFSSNFNHKEADGVTEKRGKVTGICTIHENAEVCNGEHGKNGPVCGGMTITIEACKYL
jgi:hypothetical protein